MRRLFCFLFFFILSFNAQALSLISDEETESYLYDILNPIFKAAQLPLNRSHIHIVRDDSLNAFVGDKNHMFVHTGTLLKASNSNELEGVLAHETGHILGGHILRLKIKIQDMQKATLASLIAAAGAAAASGRGDAAIAVVLGAQSSAINALTAYQMSEERAADETAVKLLAQNHRSIRGLKDFMGKIQKSNRLQGFEEMPYFRTHPITSERVNFFDNQLKKETSTVSDRMMDIRLKRIQAKIFAYLAPLDKVLSVYPLSDESTTAEIAHTVYFMRQKNLNQSLKYVNHLIEKEEKNPYFWELKAQLLFECGHVKESAEIYRKLLQLKPHSDLFILSYAEAVLSDEYDFSRQNELVAMLERISHQQNYPEAYLYLGRIYANKGEDGIAEYYSAEYNHAIGKTDLARKMVSRALKKNLRQDIKLRAKDLEEKLAQDDRQKTLF